MQVAETLRTLMSYNVIEHERLAYNTIKHFNIVMVI